MIEYFEINSTPIKLSEVRDFRVVQREMVMRPVFREVDSSVAKFFTGKSYKFEAMEPYGVIIGENSNDAATAKFNPLDMVDSVVKDVMRPVNAVVDSIGDVLNIKTIKYKKYKIRLLSDRIEETYLADIPAQVITKDQRLIDVYRNSPEHKELGEKTTSAIELVQALQIVFNNKKREMYFYGVGFHPINVSAVYEQLKIAMLSYRESVKQLEERKEQETSKGLFGIPGIKMPKIELPTISIQIGKQKTTNQIDVPLLSEQGEKQDNAEKTDGK